MKRLLFNTTLIALLCTSVVIAQTTKEIYKKSFSTNTNTKLNLEITNVHVSFETSPDDQIHVDLSLVFDNYSKKEIKEILDKVNIDARTKNNAIDLIIFSRQKLSREQYTLKVNNEGFVLDYDALDWGSKKKEEHKSKEEVLKEIRESKGVQGGLFGSLKMTDKNGKTSKIDPKTIPLIKSGFVIKIPQNVALKINGKQTQIFVQDNWSQVVDLKLNKGVLKAKNIKNKKSKISVVDANVEIESVAVQTLSLEDITRCLLGSVHETSVISKGSRIQVGFVGKDLDIRDFSSKIFLYNFDPKFETLNLKGEYTELYLFDYGKHVAMKAEGNITLMLQEGSKSSELKVAVVEKQTKNPVFGKVTAKMEKGILRIITDK
jgi:hypothetical protein